MIDLKIENNVAYVTLNRSDKLNAINMAMFDELAKVQKTLRKNRKIRAVIVNAIGEDFCSGLDIKSIMQHKKSVFKLLWKWRPGQANLAQKIVDNWRKIPVPVICAIQGRCWGAGLQLALGCDFRIAHPNSNFSIMESRWGLMPDMTGNLAMQANMQLDQAMLLSMSSNQIDSKDSLKLGLITIIDDAPLAHANQIASKLSLKSPDAIAGIKKLYYRLWHPKRASTLAYETWYQWRIILSPNQRKAVKAQKEKINAQFQRRYL